MWVEISASATEQTIVARPIHRPPTNATSSGPATELENSPVVCYPASPPLSLPRAPSTHVLNCYGLQPARPVDLPEPCTLSAGVGASGSCARIPAASATQAQLLPEPPVLSLEAVSYTPRSLDRSGVRPAINAGLRSLASIRCATCETASKIPVSAMESTCSEIERNPNRLNRSRLDNHAYRSVNVLCVFTIDRLSREKVALANRPPSHSLPGISKINALSRRNPSDRLRNTVALDFVKLRNPLLSLRAALPGLRSLLCPDCWSCASPSPAAVTIPSRPPHHHRLQRNKLRPLHSQPSPHQNPPVPSFTLKLELPAGTARPITTRMPPMARSMTKTA